MGIPEIKKKPQPFLKFNYLFLAIAALVCIFGRVSGTWAHYSPSLGRWMEEDPIAATNLYEYEASHPISSVDPLGRQTAPSQPVYEPISLQDAQSAYPKGVQTAENWGANPSATSAIMPPIHLDPNKFPGGGIAGGFIAFNNVKCPCGQDIVQEVTVITRFFDGNNKDITPNAAKSQDQYYVEAVRVANGQTVRPDSHFDITQDPQGAAKAWYHMEIITCCGKYGDKPLDPSKPSEKWDPANPQDIHCSGPNNTMTIDFTIDQNGGTSLTIPQLNIIAHRP